MKQLSILGVLLGGIVDVVSTNIAAFPIMLIAALQGNVYTLPKAQQTQALIDVMQKTTSLYIAGFILGALCSIFGGYIAALIAKRSMIFNGALSAWLCVALGVYGMTTPQNTASPTQHLFFFALSPALGALGGYLRLRQQANRTPLDLAPAR